MALLLVSFLPEPVQAASLYISPGTRTVTVGSTFTVTVKTDTQGQAVNTAEANISFSTDTLSLVRVSASSLFNLQAPGSPLAGNGTAYFGGGLPSPGYNGNSGTVGTMTFRALREGTGTVSVTSGKVLLNDGLGTNALGTTAGANFTIIPAPVGAPEITSTTHPDPNTWYPVSDVEVSWNRPNNAFGFSFELDQEVDTTPDNILDTTVTTSWTYEDLEDGAWYFHIKARQETGSFGNTAHFQILIDTEEPESFDIELKDEIDENNVSRTPTVNFGATDETSGIDHYDVLIDDEVVFSGPEETYAFGRISKGDRVVTVIAFAKAGNARIEKLSIFVSGDIGFFTREYRLPLYLLLLILLLLIILTAFIVWWVMHRRRRIVLSKVKDPVSALQLDIDKALESLKREINHKVIDLLERSSNGFFEQEEMISREINKDVNKTRRKIDKRLNKERKTKKKKVSKKIIVKKTKL